MIIILKSTKEEVTPEKYALLCEEIRDNFEKRYPFEEWVKDNDLNDDEDHHENNINEYSDFIDSARISLIESLIEEV